jgi:hypothetical protein
MNLVRKAIYGHCQGIAEHNIDAPHVNVARAPHSCGAKVGLSVRQTAITTTRQIVRRKKKKAGRSGVRPLNLELVAGVGFEPTTFGL